MHGTVYVHGDIVDRIAAMVRSRAVHFVWCTSWELDAPRLLAPLIGIPPCPVAVPDAAATYAWKAQVLDRHVADLGGPFVWTDDEAPADPQVRELRQRADGLVITPDPASGLTHTDLDAIEKFAVRW